MSGKHALDLYCTVYDKKFLDAVQILAQALGIDIAGNESKISAKSKVQCSPEQKPVQDNVLEFYELSAQSMKYLVEVRCIPESVVRELADKGLILEKKHQCFANICFINPENKHYEIVGVEKYKGKRYKQISDGVNYWGFAHCEKKDIARVGVTESAIDAISLYVLKPHSKILYVSLGGSNGREKIVKDLLEEYGPDKVVIAVDNDRAGDVFAEKFPELKRIKPDEGYKDWNEQLQGLCNKAKQDEGNTPTSLFNEKDVVVTMESAADKGDSTSQVIFSDDDDIVIIKDEDIISVNNISAFEARNIIYGDL